MNPVLIFTVFVIYTALLFVIAHFTSRKSNNEAFFKGNRKSPWFVVAYGMIGASLSGVTFMSVPGGVYTGQFTYIGIVLGYIIGYAVIALVLLPLYYKLNLTSIFGNAFRGAFRADGGGFFPAFSFVGVGFTHVSRCFCAV